VATTETAIRNKSKAKKPYKLADGTPVPGASTISGMLAKKALEIWHNKMGLMGIDTATYVDDLANIGTAAHAAIIADLSGGRAEDALIELDPASRDAAENSYLSFCAWRNQHDLKPMFLEQEFVSALLKFGGKSDFVGLVDGELELIDFKTGKGIYDNFWIQLAGYSMLVNEQGVFPVRYRILNIPRANNEDFQEEDKSDLTKHKEIFRRLLDIYWIQKSLRGENHAKS
jgi:hypothetical protein